MNFLKYIVVFVFGFFVAKIFYDNKQEVLNTHEEIQLITNGVKKVSKLVVSQGNFHEIYSFSDSKKYFYNFMKFDKKAVLSINAKVEVGYDLSKLEIKIDSVAKQIIINKIPEQEVVIVPNIKYFDLQESQFNSFTSTELNKLNQKATEKIKETIVLTKLQGEAKVRLFEELSQIYQLSKIYGWKVVNNTTNKLPIELQL